MQELTFEDTSNSLENEVHKKPKPEKATVGVFAKASRNIRATKRWRDKARN